MLAVTAESPGLNCSNGRSTLQYVGANKFVVFDFSGELIVK